MAKFCRCVLAIFLLSLPAFARDSAEGIHNFYQVDPNVYRGAQPNSEGFRYLASLGVKTVVDLRAPDARAAEESRIVTSLGMHYVNVPMRGLTPPTAAQITRILALLENTKSGGVFVHCKRGADRTGAVVAAYRIDHDQWGNTRALKEAMDCGMAIFQYPRQHFIRDFHPLSIAENAQTGNDPSEAGKPRPIGAEAVVVPQP